MNKKRWALLILCILLLAGYVKLFYKTWNNEGVTKNADCIIALDIKKITNTITWNFITNPSQWKNSSVFSSAEDGKVSWDDMIKLPDYVFVFHKAGQPANAWYTVVEINDTEDFEKGLQQFHFEKTAAGGYTAKETGIEFIQSGSKLLVGNAAVEDKRHIQQVADELFNKKQFITKDSLKDYTRGNDHLTASFSFTRNDLLQNDHFFIHGNFDNDHISFLSSFETKYDINFTANTFSYTDTSLCSFGVTQPWPGLKKVLPDSSWAAVSKTVNFNIDSLLLQSNQYYQLDIAGIYPRVDSAISYTYDNDFNPVEKVVVNTVEEPAFNFSIHGDSITKIYNYWDNSGKLEKTNGNNLFTPVPFARSYCSIKSKKELTVASNSYNAARANRSIKCIMFCRVLIGKIPASLQKYIPGNFLTLLKNIESAQVKLAYGKSIATGPNLEIVFTKRENDLPLFGY